MLRLIFVGAFALLFVTGSMSCLVVKDNTSSRRRYVKHKKRKRVRCKRHEYFDGRRCKKDRRHKKHKKHRRRD